MANLYTNYDLWLKAAYELEGELLPIPEPAPPTPPPPPVVIAEPAAKEADRKFHVARLPGFHTYDLLDRAGNVVGHYDGSVDKGYILSDPNQLMPVEDTSDAAIINRSAMKPVVREVPVETVQAYPEDPVQGQYVSPPSLTSPETTRVSVAPPAVVPAAPAPTVVK